VVTPELLLAGVDPVAVDAYALGQVRFNGRKWAPKQLRYLLRASEANLGEIDLSRLDIRNVSA
jgi:hypothetical protein